MSPASQTVVTTFARAFAIRIKAGSSSQARIRRAVESDAGVPSSALWCAWSCSASDRFVAPRTMALARPSSTCARSRQVGLPPPGHSRPQRCGQAGAVGDRVRHHPGMPYQSLPVGGH